MNQDNNFNMQGNNNNSFYQPQPNFSNTQQPINNFENSNVNNQNFNNKPPRKNNVGLLIGVIAGIVAIGIGSFVLFNNKDNNLSNDNKTNINENTPNNQEEEKIGTNTWGITFNGKSINFPCLLEDLTSVGVTLNTQEHYDKIINSANTEFVAVLAGNENWSDEIVLSLRTKDNISKKEANVVVTNIQIEKPGKNMLTKEQFHLKGDIYQGSTKDEIISVFGDNYTVVSEVDPYSHIMYEDEESELHLFFTDNALRRIQIWKKQ